MLDSMYDDLPDLVPIVISHANTGNNPTGKNGRDPKSYPSDDILSASLHDYAARGLSRAERRRQLAKDHQLDIGTTKLNKLNKQFKVPSSRSRLPHEQEQAVVLEEAEKVGHSGGPRYVHRMLMSEGYHIPRDAVRRIMRAHHPEGFAQRFPGGMKEKRQRTAMQSAGPHHQIAGDGHEKTGAQALKMGDGVNLSIYAFRDKWSGCVVLFRVLPNCRKAGTIGHIFLDLIEDLGGIPLQVTTDHGSETGYIFAWMNAIRDELAPHIDGVEFPPHVYLPSTQNTIIESFWKQFRDKSGRAFRETILSGRDLGVFDANNMLHTQVFNWLFPPLLQREADKFTRWWNYHQVRRQNNKLMPSGHVPIQVYENPESYGGMDCLVKVPKEVTQGLRELHTVEVGAKEMHYQFVSPEFSALADAAFEEIGAPALEVSTAWKVFSQMVEHLEL